MTNRHYGFTLRISTWPSESSLLYDYEAQNVCSKTYRCHGKNGRYRVLRKGTDVQLMSEDCGVEWLLSDVEVQTLLKLESAGACGYKIEGVGSPQEDDDLRRMHSRRRRRRTAAPRRSTFQHSSTPNTEDDDDHRPAEEFATPPPPTPYAAADPNEPEAQALWLVVRSLKKGSVTLKQNDVIKLGRFCFSVRQLVLSDEDLNPRSSSEGAVDATSAFQPRQSSSPEIEPIDPVSFCSADSSCGNGEFHELEEETAAGDSNTDVEVQEERPRCRFCLGDDFDPHDDPLISPCSCRGTLKWVHLKCLRTWMLERLHFKESSPCFFWKPLECELCQETYPAYISLEDEYRTGRRKSSVHLNTVASASSSIRSRIDDHYQQILDSSRGIQPSLPPEARRLFVCPTAKVPFLILESKHTNGFYVMNFGQRQALKLGRGHEADVRLADISVSRVHTVFRHRRLVTETKSGDEIQEAVIVMEDCRSKFGTLIKWRKDSPIMAQPKSIVSFQVGRTVLTVFVRQPTFSRLLSACWLDKLPRFRSRVQASPSQREDSQDVRLLETTYENT